MRQKGTLYGIGVGPGDPELLTVKAIRAIRDCDVLAAPVSGAEKRTAFDIAREYIGEKPVLFLNLPMTRDETELRKSRAEAAGAIREKLEEGKNVGFLTLGDPMVYSTYSYLHKIVVSGGYAARVIPGVTSFCAAAAALGEPLCEGREPLHIIPALYGDLESALSLTGTKVLMKTGKARRAAMNLIAAKKGLSRVLVAERVGMEGECLIRDGRFVADEDGAKAAPAEKRAPGAGKENGAKAAPAEKRAPGADSEEYFSIVIVKEGSG